MEKPCEPYSPPGQRPVQVVAYVPVPAKYSLASRLWLIAGGVILIALIVTAVVLAVVLSSEDSDDIPLALIFSQSPLVDGHNDLPHNIRTHLKNQINNFDLDMDLSTSKVWNCSGCRTDLKRLKDGLVGAQFWSAYVPCKTQYKDAVEQTLEQIDVIKRIVKKYPSKLQFATSVTEIWKALDQKKIASLIGVEGGHSIDSRLAVLRMMYDLGVRYLTLTHTCNTPWADASTVDNETGAERSFSDGLSKFGQTVVLEMNRLGMIIDLSHVSYATMNDALDTTKAPVIFSHSSAYTLCNHHRNVKDEILEKVKGNGGLVMVNFFPDFIQCNDTVRHADVDDVIDHINHIREVAGVNHVGLGSDFDGIDSLPTGLEDVSKFPYLFQRLSKSENPKWSIEDLKKLGGLNFLRVFSKVEEVRDSLSELPPFEDHIAPDRLTGHTECYTE